MTQKPVEEMTAEELREEIARLRGWTDTDRPLVHWKTPPSHPRWAWVPNWPSDIAAAWQLVEEIEKECHAVSMERGSKKQWDCVILPEEVQETWVVGEGDTAPLAICRAYVAWKRTQERPGE